MIHPDKIGAEAKKKEDENKVNEEIDNESASNNYGESENQAVIVYVTKSGKKYHVDECTHLSNSKIEKTLEEVTGKYEPCKTCNPPTK